MEFGTIVYLGEILEVRGNLQAKRMDVATEY